MRICVIKDVIDHADPAVVRVVRLRDRRANRSKLLLRSGFAEEPACKIHDLEICRISLFFVLSVEMLDQTVKHDTHRLSLGRMLNVPYC